VNIDELLKDDDVGLVEVRDSDNIKF